MFHQGGALAAAQHIIRWLTKDATEDRQAVAAPAVQTIEQQHGEQEQGGEEEEGATSATADEAVVETPGQAVSEEGGLRLGFRGLHEQGMEVLDSGEGSAGSMVGEQVKAEEQQQQQEGQEEGEDERAVRLLDCVGQRLKHQVLLLKVMQVLLPEEQEDAAVYGEGSLGGRGMDGESG